MKLKLSFLALFTLLLSSCNSIDDLFTFSIDNNATIAIKSSFPVGSPFEVITPEVTTNSSSSFENNKTKASLVKEVKLKSLQLKITSPENKTFTFLKSIRLYISTNDSNEIELAFQENINATSNTIDLQCTTAELDEYLKGDSYQIRTEVTLKETVTENISVDAKMKFKVTANLF